MNRNLLQFSLTAQFLIEMPGDHDMSDVNEQIDRLGAIFGLALNEGLITGSSDNELVALNTEVLWEKSWAVLS